MSPSTKNITFVQVLLPQLNMITLIITIVTIVITVIVVVIIIMIITITITIIIWILKRFNRLSSSHN